MILQGYVKNLIHCIPTITMTTATKFGKVVADNEELSQGLPSSVCSVPDVRHFFLCGPKIYQAYVIMYSFSPIYQSHHQLQDALDVPTWQHKHLSIHAFIDNMKSFLVLLYFFMSRRCIGLKWKSGVSDIIVTLKLMQGSMTIISLT